MLKDLGLDLDLTRSKKPFKVQLALPSKVITQNILNINTANISDVKLNSLPHFEFEIPYLVESKSKGVTDEIEYIKNPDLDNIKEEKLIKLTWYGGRVNWFRIMTIEKNDSSEGISTKISCDSLESELRKTNVTIDGTGIGAEEYFSKALEQSPWKLGYVSEKLKNTYRTFSDQDKQTRYEAIQSGIESYGAITDFDGETRTLNLLTIDELRIFRGVVLKRENYASSIDITSTSEEIVTRMYGKGNENLNISSANPTGMRYIEDFSYFMHPFERVEKDIHKAYSWSADGTNGFTTVYPNLNLLTDSKDFKNKNVAESKANTSITSPYSVVMTENDTTFLRFSRVDGGVQDWFRAYLNRRTQSPNFTNVDIKGNTNYTFSVWLKGTGTHTLIAYDSWTNPINARQSVTLTSDWKLYTFTVLSRPSADLPADKMVQFFIRSDTVGSEINLKYPKVEEGSTATPWMPSSSEVTDSDYPQFVGHSKESSQNSTDYKWYPVNKEPIEYDVTQHSAYMSDDLSHALLDLIELQKIYNPRIDDLQKLINQAYVDLTKKMTEKVDLDGEMLTLQALLDTAKSTNDKSLITQRQTEIVAKQKQIDDKVSEIDSINASIELWNKTIVDYQEIISTNSFEPKLVEELKLFVYEKDFSDDRYIDAKELYEATVKEFEKYQKPTRSFKTDLASFINSIESKKYHGRLEIGEEVKIKSEKLGEEYTSIILGYSGDLISGDFQLEISDNMDDIDALDRLATIIYQAESSSSILSNNKYKWNNIVEVKDEVTAWRDKEINTVNNRIVAGANESITIDNRGMMVRNPDFPNEVIIIQSGVVALSRDNGNTWNTSITPNGVIADTLIGKILAGNNLIITNDSGSFVIDNTGMTVKMDSIRIMSGDEGDPKNIIESWNKLLLTYDEIASDNLVNEYEKNQLKIQWNKIEDIHSSMIKAFLKGWSQKPVEEPDPENPNQNPEPDYPEEYDIYIKAYEDLNEYLNITKQSDGYALLDETNKTKTTTVDPEEFKKKFLDYDKAKQELESIISFTYTHSQIKVLETGISLEYVKNDNIVTALNLSEEGVRIDGKLLEINSKTEFNADLVMNAGVIKGKDDGIIIDLNTGEIKLNKKVTIGAGSNLITDDDIAPLKGTIVSTLSNDLSTIFTDANGSSGNYDYALTEMNIYKDGVLDNNNWDFSVEKNDNVIYTSTKNSVKVSSIKTDSETLVIVAKQGKDTIKEEFKINKYAGTTGDVNRWMIVPDAIHKTIREEWVGIPLVVMGNEQLVGKNTKPYSGRYKISESKDGGLNYSVKYTSSTNESNISYKPTKTDVTHIKVQFYLAGNTLNLIDEQILPIIVDKNRISSYKAYSWSSDGTDRFTTVYPNVNLLNGSKFPDNQLQEPWGSYENGGTVEISDGEYNYLTPSTNTDGDKQGGLYYTDTSIMTAEKSYVFSAKVKGIGTIRISYQYTYDDETTSPWIQGEDTVLTDDYSLIKAIIPPQTKVFTKVIITLYFQEASVGSIKEPKLEEGDVATIWTPSESEYQDDWMSVTPKYIGYGEKDSQIPSDYEWNLNIDYVQANSDNSLSNKAGLDDLASVSNTANDALVQAQNAVSNEDYTSWLEHDYQSTIDDLQDVSIQNQEDIRNVDDRTTAVEGFYDEMKIKWNFIDESFTFSEEGMFISNSQSKMAIQVTSDKIVFWDNDVDVAFITGEVLNIQRGVFLESATIGNHLITKFSDDSPVTIITYVGGTN